MRLPWWKIHILTVLILTGINIYLLMKWIRSSGSPGPGDCDRAMRSAEGTEPEEGAWRKSLTAEEPSFRADEEGAEELPPQMFPPRDEHEHVLLRPGRRDNSREFVIRDYAWTGRLFQSTAVNQDVCLATQSSLDRLHWLGQTADHWRGAISVAVYLADEEEAAIFQRVLSHLGRCHPELLSYVAFHTVSSASITAVMSRSTTASSTSSSSSASMGDESATRRGESLAGNCTGGPSSSLDWLKRMRTSTSGSSSSSSLSAKWATASRPYPQNLMRNVARKACPSQYVFLVDVDVIPSFNMAESLAAFLDSPAVAHCLKCAFVVPTYELDTRAGFPQNKSQLVQLEDQKLAQPFHQKAFRYNQFASNLTRWRQTPDTDQVIIHHNVTNYEFFYEPFYIARDDAPAHDERFIGYGFTRNTQVYEMALSGWTFHVLSPVFTIHWGMQMKQRQPTWRRSQIDRNRRVFDLIQLELKAKYGLLNGTMNGSHKSGKIVHWRPVKI